MTVLVRNEAIYVLANCVLEAASAFDKKDALLFPRVPVTLDEGKTMIQAKGPNNHTYKIRSGDAIGNFKMKTPHGAANTKLASHAQVLLKNNHPGECEHIVTQLFHAQTENHIKRW